MSRREDVAFALAKFPISQRRACGLLQMDRSSCRYEAQPEREPEVVEEVKQMAEEHPRYGYRRVTALLRKSGRRVNHKRISRLRLQLGVTVSRKSRKRLKRAPVSAPEATAANQQWAMDFVSDAAANGQKLRVLTLIDVFTRECLAMEVTTSIGCRRVARVLGRVLAGGRPAPASIRVDNGLNASDFLKA